MSTIITPRREIETAALELVAEWLEMAIDEKIFRGGMPVGAIDAAAVWLGESSRGKHDIISTHAIRVIGKFAARDDAAAMTETVAEHTPCGFTVRSGVVFHYIDCPGVNEPYQDASGGALVWCVSLTLTAMARAALTSELS